MIRTVHTDGAERRTAVKLINSLPLDNKLFLRAQASLAELASRTVDRVLECFTGREFHGFRGGDM
ncbi:hypothetical protein [Caballeronia sp. LZ019]|uniref:hypothetical protein n=1 Tax=Caballeronia sp. LZ019 TaxID=3038555 RepID=UPI002864147A|nr:hypothetical protein [Caballeronia sp. LZ019]MDR5809258.1 hypothetical protein [Caballeronia sp. LZ019]